MSTKEMQAEIERLTALNDSMKASLSKDIKIKVSEKGGVSVYGLGRFPVTLYKEQWLKLLTVIESLQQFITDHDSELTMKS
jgi:hypothetical protein